MRRTAAPLARLAVAAGLCLAPAALAAPVPPSTHLGFAAGGQLVVTEWDAGLADAGGAPVSPEGDGFLRVRLGQQFTPRFGVEVGVSYLPLSAEGALATGMLYDADLLIGLKDGPVTPLLVLGGGAYQVFDGDESDVDAQFHYGFELRGRLNQRVAVRGGLRHIFADSLEPDQDFSNHIELSFGFDLLFGADAID